ncbi:hypothetical protein V8E54_008621 [Elaphomyces granulatus]
MSSMQGNTYDYSEGFNMMTDQDTCMNFMWIPRMKFTDTDFANASTRRSGPGRYERPTLKPFIAPCLRSPAESHRSIGINSPLGGPILLGL